MHFSFAFYFDTLFSIKHKPDPGKYKDTSQTAIPIAVVILIWNSTPITKRSSNHSRKLIKILF